MNGNREMLSLLLIMSLMINGHSGNKNLETKLWWMDLILSPSMFKDMKMTSSSISMAWTAPSLTKALPKHGLPTNQRRRLSSKHFWLVLVLYLVPAQLWKLETLSMLAITCHGLITTILNLPLTTLKLMFQVAMI